MINTREKAKAILHELIVSLSTREQLVKLLSLVENKELVGWVGAVSVDEIESVFEFHSCKANEETQCIEISRTANKELNCFVSIIISIRLDDIRRVSADYDGDLYEIALHMNGRHDVLLSFEFSEKLVNDDEDDYEDEDGDETDRDVPDVEFVTILHVGGKDYEVLCRGGEDGIHEWDPIFFERQVTDKGELVLEDVAGNVFADIMAAWTFYISTRQPGIQHVNYSCECVSHTPDNNEEDPE